MGAVLVFALSAGVEGTWSTLRGWAAPIPQGAHTLDGPLLLVAELGLLGAVLALVAAIAPASRVGRGPRRRARAPRSRPGSR
ncbi:hypothetical protein OG455_17610 [Kitasatospora sp. NBC_01287]|uniref:hypothetical protein n=1 Tax=Kitasatospora sp. NBC_01287 TaxID=2903573 RepID=UPI002258EDE5|nr:hypothetical protein [Kitasatospora sp. NBC_01287]MCX4747316.1 hypothetical protein [Kitasatospora sp. NBC_01287]